jgi:hypothetical protein
MPSLIFCPEAWVEKGVGAGGARPPPHHHFTSRICKRLRRRGIDSEDSIPLAYVAWRAGMTKRVVVPVCQPGNRFLGSFKGLQIRALICGYFS